MFEAITDFKALSASSNVHVDIINHVAGSLAAHVQQFHHSWCDYGLVFLRVFSLLFSYSVLL